MWDPKEGKDLEFPTFNRAAASLTNDQAREDIKLLTPGLDNTRLFISLTAASFNKSLESCYRW